MRAGRARLRSPFVLASRSGGEVALATRVESIETEARDPIAIGAVVAKPLELAPINQSPAVRPQAQHAGLNPFVSSETVHILWTVAGMVAVCLHREITPMSAMTFIAAQEQFTATLSAVEDAVKFAFRRRLRPQEYEEALAEARAAAWSAWHGLLRRGKNPVEVGIHGIASNAIRYVRNGRRLGNKSSGRGGMDLYNPKAQARCGFRLVSLDAGDDADHGDSSSGSWRGWLTEDRRVGPADLACSRLDFESWLAGLPAKKRRIAELLAEGHEGIVVARMVGVSPGRVCQVRPELERSWEAFQAQGGADQVRAAVLAG